MIGRRAASSRSPDICPTSRPPGRTEQFFGLTLGPRRPLRGQLPRGAGDGAGKHPRGRGRGPDPHARGSGRASRRWSSPRCWMRDPFAGGCYDCGMAVGRRVNLTVLAGGQVGPVQRLLYRARGPGWCCAPCATTSAFSRPTSSVSGGSGMAPEVFRFFQAMGVPLRNIFGATEIGLFTHAPGRAPMTWRPWASWLPVHPSLGPPLEYRVSDEGELLVRGGVGFQRLLQEPGGHRQEDSSTASTAPSDAVYLTDKKRDGLPGAAGGHAPARRRPLAIRRSSSRTASASALSSRTSMTLGDTDKPFVAAFINIDSSTLGPWAEQRGIGYTIVHRPVAESRRSGS